MAGIADVVDIRTAPLLTDAERPAAILAIAGQAGQGPKRLLLSGVLTGAEIVALIDAQLGSTDWRSGVAPVTDHTRFALWTNTPTPPSAAEFTASASQSQTDTISVGYGGIRRAYLHFATINASAATIDFDGNLVGNLRADFSPVPAEIMLNGVAHYIYSSLARWTASTQPTDWTIS